MYNCEACNTEFKRKRGTVGRFCRPQCYWSTLKGNSYSGNRGKNFSGMSGKSHSEETKEKMRAIRSGKSCPWQENERHHGWKGEEVSYRSLHSWVVRKKGQPDTCTQCGTSGLTGRQIHWANVDGKYRRKLEDFIRMCRDCHTSYDSNLRKQICH